MNAWLIEWVKADGNLMGLCLGPSRCRPDKVDWVVPECALRFSRKADADAAANLLVTNGLARAQCRAVEHGFDESSNKALSNPCKD